MSYEGYRQFFCENGHETRRDAYDSAPDKCTWCGGKITGFHGVDTTNDDGDPVELKIIGTDSFLCKCCGGGGQQIVNRYNTRNRNIIKL